MKYRLFAFLFLWCAIVQHNDPDPHIWIFIYLTNSIIFEMAYRGLIFPYLSIDLVRYVFSLFSMILLVLKRLPKSSLISVLWRCSPGAKFGRYTQPLPVPGGS